MSAWAEAADELEKTHSPQDLEALIACWRARARRICRLQFYDEVHGESVTFVHLARELGLPESSTWPQIRQVLHAAV